MKTKNILLAFTSILLITVYSCGSVNLKNQPPLNQIQHIETGDIQVVQIDSCEYVIWNYGYAGGIVHKQNCKFCIERNK